MIKDLSSISLLIKVTITFLMDLHQPSRTYCDIRSCSLEHNESIYLKCGVMRPLLSQHVSYFARNSTDTKYNVVYDKLFLVFLGFNHEHTCQFFGLLMWRAEKLNS